MYFVNFTATFVNFIQIREPQAFQLKNLTKQIAFLHFFLRNKLTFNILYLKQIDILHIYLIQIDP